MACNVFGTPVTDQFLKELPEYYSYDIEITQKQLARVALIKKNAEGKDVNARKFVEALQRRFEDQDDEEKNIALCLMYNATGAPLMFVEHHTWSGHLGGSPVPARIENGQWGAFVTVRYKNEGNNDGYSCCCSWFVGGDHHHKRYDKKDYKSRSSVVYCGKNSDGRERHWVVSWSSNHKSTNQVYAEIGEPGEFKGREKWKRVEDQLSRGTLHHSAKMDKGFIFGMIGNDKSAIVETIFTLPDVWFSI